MSNSSQTYDSDETDIQTLYRKIKKLLLTYPLRAVWSESYETINSLHISVILYLPQSSR